MDTNVIIFLILFITSIALINAYIIYHNNELINNNAKRLDNESKKIEILELKANNT
jgi:hypothetical protein